MKWFGDQKEDFLPHSSFWFKDLFSINGVIVNATWYRFLKGCQHQHQPSSPYLHVSCHDVRIFGSEFFVWGNMCWQLLIYQSIWLLLYRTLPFSFQALCQNHSIKNNLDIIPTLYQKYKSTHAPFQVNMCVMCAFESVHRCELI